MVTGACVALVPWTVALAITLPRHYTASHWRLTWVGLDVAMAFFLGRTAWLTYRRRRRPAVTSAIVTATLLCVDAWFDVTTATGRPDRLVSLASAVLGELPLAGFLIYVATRRAVDDGRMRNVPITDDMIRLGQFLKLAGVVDSGADTKTRIGAGDVRVNGEIEDRRGAQLHRGDIVTIDGERLRVS